MGTTMYAEGVAALGHGATRPRGCECDRPLTVREQDSNGRVDVQCVKCGRPVDDD